MPFRDLLPWVLAPGRGCILLLSLSSLILSLFSHLIIVNSLVIKGRLGEVFKLNLLLAGRTGLIQHNYDARLIIMIRSRGN